MWFQLIFAGVLAVSLGGAPWAWGATEAETGLTLRAQAVDEETGEPVPGIVLMLHWDREVLGCTAIAPAGSSTTWSRPPPTSRGG